MLEAVSVYPIPDLLMERGENVATPSETVTADPPVSVPLPGFAPRVSVTWVVLSPDSMLPLASSTATVTGGEIVDPAAVLVGPWTKVRWLAAPGVMVKGDEVAPVQDGVLVAASVYPLPVLLMARPENVATPEATVTAEPPVRVPESGFVPIATLTCVVLFPVSTLPVASSTATVTAGEIVEPAAVLDGPWRKARWVGVPGESVIVDDVAMTTPSAASVAERV